jgi:uncharacterized protein (DUF1697 family)
MNTYIALLRGINVGGANILPMRELVEVLDSLGLQKVQTYIQSGNVVFQSEVAEPEDLASQIKEAINHSHGFAPQVLVLQRQELERAVAANPFPEAAAVPKTLHFYFLASVPPQPDLETLESIKRDSERFELLGRVFYLHAPDGIGRSKLVARIEKALGVAATGRNWRTVSRIVAMVEGMT